MITFSRVGISSHPGHDPVEDIGVARNKIATFRIINYIGNFVQGKGGIDGYYNGQRN